MLGQEDAAMKVLVTGATGMVGRALMAALADCPGVTPVAGVRAPGYAGPHLVLGDLSRPLILPDAGLPVDAVIHTAARVHQMTETAADPLAAYHAVNTRATLDLARAAVRGGAKRFVFVSTIKVNGDGRETPYRPDEPVIPPTDPYGASKYAAEQGLWALAAETGLEVVVVRPPLVYGPGVGANFARLLRAVDRGVPLPFGLVNNRRSLVGLQTLTDALLTVLTHPAAAGKTYLVSDGEDVSSAGLVRAMAQALGRSPRLLPVPPPLMRLAARLLGKEAQVNRLLGSLTVDLSALRQDCDWSPPATVAAQLAATVRWYRDQA